MFKTSPLQYMHSLRRSAFTGFSSAAIILLALSHAGQAENGVFDIRLGGLKAGTLAYNATIQGQSYAVATRIGSGGLVRALLDFQFDGLSRGRLTSQTLVPSSYKETTHYKKKTSGLTMTYVNGAPQHVEFTPPRQAKPYDADPKTQQNTLDPVSLIFNLLRPWPKNQLCAQNLQLYDGRRRMQLTLGAAKPEGDSIQCTAELRRIAGFKAKDMAKKASFPLILTYSLREDGQHHLSRIISPSRYGTVVLNRR